MPGASILIILMGSVGDVARGLALVNVIKKGRPDCRITWLVEPRCAGLVRLHRGIDKVIVFERSRGLRGVWDLWRVLQGEVFDVTLDLQRHFKSGFFSLLSGAGRRIGFHRRNSKELNFLFNNEHVGYFDDSLSKLDHYLKFAGHLAINVEQPLDFGLGQLAVTSTAQTALDRTGSDYIALIMGSAWETKDWTEQGYADLIKRILAEFSDNVVLLGDSKPVALSARIEETISSKRVINLTGQTDLPGLLAILKGARACVGPDSGPGHLCAALGTPHVTIFGPTSEKRVAPYHCEHLTVRAAVDCSPCNRRQCRGFNRQCMRLISGDQVFAVLCKALARS